MLTSNWVLRVERLPNKKDIGFTKVLWKLSFSLRIHNRYSVFSVRNVAQIILYVK